MKEEFEKSRGIIIFDDNDKVLVVRHLDGHYGFPKGHVEEGESDLDTAIREVKEETQCDFEIIDGFKEPYYYTLKNGKRKEVILFLGRAKSSTLVPQNTEISDALFMPTKEAYEVLKGYDDMIDKLKLAEKFIKDKENKNDRD